MGLTPNNHNGGPPLDPFAAHEIAILDLMELASGCLTGGAIDTPEKAAQVDELLDDIKKAEAALEATRKAEKAPWDAGAKAVQDAVKPLATKLAVAKKTAQDALTPFRLAEQAKRDAEAKAKRDEAERLAAEALAAFQSTPVTDLDARLAADELAKEAAKAHAAANRIDKTATGLRSKQVATVTDRRALLQWIMKHDPETLGAWLVEYAQKNTHRAFMGGVVIETVKEAR